MLAKYPAIEGSAEPRGALAVCERLLFGRGEIWDVVLAPLQARTPTGPETRLKTAQCFLQRRHYALLSPTEAMVVLFFFRHQSQDMQIWRGGFTWLIKPII